MKAWRLDPAGELKKHRERLDAQRQAYREDKQRLKGSSHLRIFCIDFTCFELNTHSEKFQDLIVTQFDHSMEEIAQHSEGSKEREAAAPIEEEGMHNIEEEELDEEEQEEEAEEKDWDEEDLDETDEENERESSAPAPPTTATEISPACLPSETVATSSSPTAAARSSSSSSRGESNQSESPHWRRELLRTNRGRKRKRQNTLPENAGSPWQLKFHHHLATAKNNANFVAEVMKDFVARCPQEGINEVHIWSDGASKHFKQAYMQQWWADQAQRFPTVSLVLNYFESHHGASECDAAAHHGKSKVNEDHLVHGSTLKGEGLEAAAAAIRLLRNTTAQVLSTIGEHVDSEAKPIKPVPIQFEQGTRPLLLRDIHKIAFLRDGEAQLFLLSKDERPVHTFHGWKHLQQQQQRPSTDLE